jgi:tetratricopeptide (TPR) repeat protein
MKKIICAFLAFLPACLCAAATNGRDMAFEARLEQELAQINPALVEPFRNARIAFDKADYAESARLLTPIIEKAPQFDAAVRRLGSSLAHSGRQQEGLAWAEKAVALKRSAPNLGTLANVLAFPAKGEASKTDRERALQLLQECRTQPDGDDAYVLSSMAQVALQLRQPEEARAAVTLMLKKFPELMATHYYAAVIAAMDEHWVRAEDEILRAGKLGLDSAQVQRFLDSGVHSRAVAWRYIHWSGWTIGGWVLGLLLLCGVGYGLSTLTLRQIERADPSVAIALGERRLRKIYRAVLNVAGLYYYISLPVVMALVLLAAGAIFYGFLVIGWIPIKLTVILAIGALATIWSMGRSLFLRVESSDPGRALERGEAEALWRLTDEVAQNLNTRPIDEIRITPGTDLCVYERGNWREKLENRAKRVLVLGRRCAEGFQAGGFSLRARA